MLPVLRKWHTPAVRDELFTNLDTFFTDFFKDDFFQLVKTQGLTPSQGGYPRVDVTAFDDRVEIIAEVPGMKKEDVEVQVCEGLLTIKGNKRQDTEEKKGGKVVYKELKRSSFQRSFVVDDTLDTNSIDAKFDNGVLTIVIKKLEPSKVAPEIKKVTIN